MARPDFKRSKEAKRKSANAELGMARPDFERSRGETERDDSPVDCRPVERPSQDGSGRYPSEAGTAKRRGPAKKRTYEARKATALRPAELTTLLNASIIELAGRVGRSRASLRSRHLYIHVRRIRQF